MIIIQPFTMAKWQIVLKTSEATKETKETKDQNDNNKQTNNTCFVRVDGIPV